MVLFFCFFGRRLLLDNALGDYPAKSGPITSLSQLISRSASSWRTMLFHSIRSFRHLLYPLYSLSYSIYPCARVSARYSQPRSFPGFFPFNFLVFLPLCLHQRYQSLYLYLRPSPPLPRILTSDCNFGSFVSSSLGNLLFLPVLYLIFSFNHELSIDPSFIVQLASSVLNFPVPHPPDVFRILISSHFSYLIFFSSIWENLKPHDSRKRRNFTMYRSLGLT